MERLLSRFFHKFHTKDGVTALNLLRQEMFFCSPENSWFLRYKVLSPHRRYVMWNIMLPSQRPKFCDLILNNPVTYLVSTIKPMTIMTMSVRNTQRRWVNRTEDRTKHLLQHSKQLKGCYHDGVQLFLNIHYRIDCRVPKCDVKVAGSKQFCPEPWTLTLTCSSLLLEWFGNEPHAQLCRLEPVIWMTSKYDVSTSVESDAPLNVNQNASCIYYMSLGRTLFVLPSNKYCMQFMFWLLRYNYL